MEPVHTLLARAQLMLKMAAASASLKIPAEVPGGPPMRERLVQEYALLESVKRLIEAAPPGARFVVILLHAIVEIGRGYGAEFDDIIAEIADATRQAVEARAKHELRQAKAEEAAAPPPTIIKPN